MTVPFRIRRAEWLAGGFIVALGAVVLLALLVTARSSGTFETPARFQVLLADGHGVTAGGRVQMLGLDAGRVTDVRITEDNRVEVQLEVRPAFADKVRSDSVAMLEASFGLEGVLTGVGIAISPGTTEMPAVEAGGTIAAVEPEHLADLVLGVDSNPLVEDLSILLRNLRLVSDEAVASESSVQKILASLAIVALRIERGQGTVGQLLADDGSLYQQVVATVDRVAATVERAGDVVRRGEGLVRRSDQAVAGISRGVDEAVALMADTRGLLRAAGDSLDQTDGVLEHADEAVVKLAASVDALGAVATDLSRVTQKLDVLIAEIRVVTDAAGRVYPIRRHMPKSRRERASDAGAGSSPR